MSGWKIPCFRGSEEDVLGRFSAAAETFDATHVVRVNADNPLVDPRYIDRLLEAAIVTGADYTSYRRADSKPVMLTAVSFFTEVVGRSCLQRANDEIVDPFQREHVTLGIYTRPDLFKVHWLDLPATCNDHRLRFTLDTAEDLELLRDVFNYLGKNAIAATAEEIVHAASAHPWWLDTMAKLNATNPKSDQKE